MIHPSRSLVSSINGLMNCFQVQGLVFEEEESEEASSDPSPRKKSVVSQGEVEKLLIKWAQEMLKG